MAGFRVEFDDSEMRTLVVDISDAPGRMQRNASEATIKGARLINKAMIKDATGHRHLRGLPKAVSYQLITSLEAEIGLSPGGQGSLAHIIAYGSVNNAPVYDHTAGPRAVQPKVDEIYAKAAEDSALGGDS